MARMILTALGVAALGGVFAALTGALMEVVRALLSHRGNELIHRGFRENIRHILS